MRMMQGLPTRLAALAAAAYAASASAVGLGLLGGPVVQPLLAASSTAAVALALASRPRPVRGSWGLPAAAAAAAVGLAFAVLVAGFGASLNPAAPTPLAGLLNVALLLPQALAPVAAASLLPAAAAPLAAGLLALAASPPSAAGLGAILSAAARASAAAVGGYAAARWGLASGLLYASIASMPRLLLPVAPAAPAALAGAVGLGGHAAAALLLAAGGRPGGSTRFPAVVAALAVAVLAASSLAASRGYYVLVVATGSMEPAYRPGDVVLVAPGAPEPGDVAAYIQPGSGRIILHRLASIEGRSLVFKGDANPEPDPPVPREALLGLAVVRLPRIGLPYIVLGEALGSPLAPPVLLAAAAGLLAWRSRPDD